MKQNGDAGRSPAADAAAADNDPDVDKKLTKPMEDRKVSIK